MYNITGQIINAFTSPASEKYEASYRLQLLGDSPLKDGQVKKEMITLSVPLPIFEKLQSQLGKTVTLPIGFFVQNGQLVTFYPKQQGGSGPVLPA